LLVVGKKRDGASRGRSDGKTGKGEQKSLSHEKQLVASVSVTITRDIFDPQGEREWSDVTSRTTERTVEMETVGRLV